MEINNINEIYKKFQYLFKDNENIMNVLEITTLNDSEIPLESFLELFTLENKIVSLKRGIFSININERYLIIMESFKLSIKQCVKEFILKIRKNISSLNHDEKYNISTFSNFILYFYPEFYTLYNIKKEIFQNLEIKELDSFIMSELLFINIINEKYRQASISWDYRLFLFSNYSKIIQNKYQLYVEKDKFSKFLKHMDNLSLYFDNIASFSEEDNLYLWELSMINSINEKGKRNYQLWKYLIHLTKLITNKFLIFNFVLYLFLSDPLDYSAYSYLKTFSKEILKTVKLKKIELQYYFEKLLTTLIDENNNKYFVDIYSLFLGTTK
jgi:hypothetical protein